MASDHRDGRRSRTAATPAATHPSVPAVLRCSAVLFRRDTVLLVHRVRNGVDDWVLPGGTPRPTESAGGCVRRELREETGLRADVTAVAFVLDAVDHGSGLSTTDIVFTMAERDSTAAVHGERAGAEPRFVPLAELAGLHLRPPIAGHLRGLHRTGWSRTAAYLGNLWRPGPSIGRPGPVRRGDALAADLASSTADHADM